MDSGPFVASLICLVPFLAGIGVTLLIQHRIKIIGLPWALLPAGGILKALWARLWEHQ